MTDNYSAIGAYLSTEGLATVRFNLKGDKFQVISTNIIEKMPTYGEVFEQLKKLSKLSNETGEVTALTNFLPFIKTLLIHRFNSDCDQMFFRIMSPEITDESIFHLENVIASKRFTLNHESKDLITTSLKIWKTDKQKEQEHLLVNALFCSVSFAEQRRLQKMISSSFSSVSI